MSEKNEAEEVVVSAGGGAAAAPNLPRELVCRRFFGESWERARFPFYCQNNVS
jgi:hypothetical protein